MLIDKLTAKWNSKQGTVNGWLALGNNFSAEIMGGLGFDSLTIDLQHGLLDYSDAKSMLGAMSSNGVPPLVRIPWLDQGITMKMLDAGALGIICPMINNREQAETFVSAMRYPPRGNRSFGPIRAQVAYGKDYYSRANEKVLAFGMIETAQGVENLDEICQVEGLDGIYIGPSDLTIGVTNGRLAPGFDRREPEMHDTIMRILTTAKKYDLYAGIHCGGAKYASEAISWGFNMTTIGSDTSFIADAGSKIVSDFKRLTSSEPGASANDDAAGSSY